MSIEHFPCSPLSHSFLNKVNCIRNARTAADVEHACFVFNKDMFALQENDERCEDAVPLIQELLEFGTAQTLCDKFRLANDSPQLSTELVTAIMMLLKGTHGNGTEHRSLPPDLRCCHAVETVLHTIQLFPDEHDLQAYCVHTLYLLLKTSRDDGYHDLERSARSIGAVVLGVMERFESSPFFFVQSTLILELILANMNKNTSQQFRKKALARIQVGLDVFPEALDTARAVLNMLAPSTGKSITAFI